MHYKWKNEYIQIDIQEDQDVVTLHGKINDRNQYDEVMLFAPNPIDRMTNYSGSGLAFPNSSIAFESTPNVYFVETQGIVHTTFRKPNSYYANDTMTKVKPSIFLKLTVPQKTEPILLRFELEDTLPLRTVFYRPERTGPEFYHKKAEILGVSSQESILRRIEEVKIKHQCA